MRETVLSLKSCVEDKIREREAEEFGKVNLYRGFGGKREFNNFAWW